MTGSNTGWTTPTAVRWHRAAHSALGVLALMACAGAMAQQVYRIVGPDGRVTFSDQPPPANAKAAPVTPGGGPAASAGPGLPFELRQVASRYPVTLYTGNNCTPCQTARTYLQQRGVPFTERTVTTAEDSEALKRLSGDTVLPFATIGRQQVKGFSDAEWGQYLTAAGYPAQSQLPATWRNPPPAPLVAAQRPPVSVSPPAMDSIPPGSTIVGGEAPQGGDAAPAPSAPARDPANPAGIRF